jgi:hypothetical protein
LGTTSINPSQGCGVCSILQKMQFLFGGMACAFS